MHAGGGPSIQRTLCAQYRMGIMTARTGEQSAIPTRVKVMFVNEAKGTTASPARNHHGDPISEQHAIGV